MELGTDIEHLLGSLAPYIQEYGVLAVMVILTFESIGIPLPGESLLIVASVLAARGELSLPALMVSAWAGAVTGDNLGYLLGRRFGRALILRWGAKIGITAGALAKVEAVFARYGAVTVAFARFLNVLRQLNGIVAGIAKMEWKRFLFFNALGGAMWVIVWTSAGYYLGKHVSNFAAIAQRLEHGGALIAIGLLIAALGYGAWRVRRQES
ncbi:MAG: DedA family protein [Beijerinckiaceae bacterium]|nr:DedA family protein [Beijerinckiaceae bacterium]MCI0736415.1 DedA family protein [Beijerinckiaceae bacterium]